MFSLLHDRGRWMGELGEALDEARETYRADSRGGEPAAAEIDETQLAQDPRAARGS